MTNPDSRDLLVGLVLAGFAVRAGLFPLHLWAPQAYRAVPVSRFAPAPCIPIRSRRAGLALLAALG